MMTDDQELLSILSHWGILLSLIKGNLKKGFRLDRVCELVPGGLVYRTL